MKNNIIFFALFALVLSVFACPDPNLSRGYAGILDKNGSSSRHPHSGPASRHLQGRGVWIDEAAGVQRWPDDDSYRATPTPEYPHYRPLTFIPYCFVNKETEEQVGPGIEAAIAEWLFALGGDQYMDPSPQSGHTLSFQRVTMYCYNDYQDISNRGTWNIPAGYEKTLAIHLNKAPAARQGYTPPDSAIINTPDEPGRHYMYLPPFPKQTDPNYFQVLGTYCHELGHVLGLGHEHQHPDAPVKIRPQNMVGYKQTTEFCLNTFAVRQPGGAPQPFEYLANDPDKIEKMGQLLCQPENYGYAAACANMCTDYMKNRPGQKSDRPYDPDSIMHYGSQINVGDGESYPFWQDTAQEWDPEKAAISRLDPDGTEHPIIKTDKISAGDVAMIKKHYAW